MRQSSIFRAAEWLGRGASVWSLPVSAVMRRHGLRRRLSAVLIIAALGPVIAVSVVAVALIFSSVEQGIEFEAVRGLQVARGLFLQQVQSLAAGAAELGDDVALLRAQATAPHAARQRLGELSLKMPSALFETTDATGRVIARCTHGSCEDAPSAAAGALEPSDRSPVILRALGYERTVSVERARYWLVVRAALPPWIRRCGCSGRPSSRRGSTAPSSIALKAALGAGREVVVYAAGDPNASTFMAATGARLAGPLLPSDFTTAGLGTGTPVVAARGREPSLFGRARPAPGRDRARGRPARRRRRSRTAGRRGRRASTALILGALSALLLAMVLSNVLARRMTRPLQNLHAGALAIARGDLDTSFAVDTDDEIGDVAEAFRIMTRSLRENQEGWRRACASW